MTFKIDEATASLVAQLATETGHKIGDGELPAGLAAGEPFVIVYSITGSAYGSMASDIEIAEMNYQLKIVGQSQAQCRKLQQAVHAALDEACLATTGSMGLGRIIVGGIVKEDDRTFVANDTLIISIN